MMLKFKVLIIGAMVVGGLGFGLATGATLRYASMRPVTQAQAGYIQPAQISHPQVTPHPSIASLKGAAAKPKPKASVKPKPRPTSLPNRDDGYYMGESVSHQILRVFGMYAQQSLLIAGCESGLNPKAQNPNTGDAGVFQFTPGTWALTPYSKHSPFDARWNILAAWWLFQHDNYKWGDDWVCAHLVGLK